MIKINNPFLYYWLKTFVQKEDMMIFIEEIYKIVPIIDFKVLKKLMIKNC